VCDASEGMVKTGQTDPKVLLAYLRKGVNVRSHSGLHAKAIVRGRVAIVGSANSSNTSANGQLSELVAILRDRPAINWNEWSRSIGSAGRDHPVRAPAAADATMVLLQAPAREPGRLVGVLLALSDVGRGIDRNNAGRDALGGAYSEGGHVGGKRHAPRKRRGAGTGCGSRAAGSLGKIIACLCEAVHTLSGTASAK